LISSYTRYRDYSQFQSDNPNTDLNGSDLDTDLDRIKTVCDAVVAGIADVRKDDGTVKNAVIGVDQLKSEVITLLNGVTPRGDWAGLTVYAVSDLVRKDDVLYFALSAHTSGVFATDLADDKWMSISSAASASSIANTPAGSIAATNVQTALNELDTEKQPIDATLTALAAVTVAANKLIYATGADTFSTTDLTAAARTVLDDATVADMLTTLGALPAAGGTMTGALTLSGAPSSSLHAATKAYVDASVGGAATTIPAGTLMPYTGYVLPDGYLWANGQAHSRTTYADLYAATNKTGTATMTIASPGVVTWTAHGLSESWPVKFSTTGALPTGITAGTTYYLKSVTTDTFRLAATPGGADINTSGSQSGVHTAIFSPHGNGNGSTTFNVIDMRGRSAFGLDDMFTSAASRVTSAGSSINGKTPAATGGAETVTIATGNLPSGNYVTSVSGLDAGTAITDTSPSGSLASTFASTSISGSGTAVNKMPPAIMVPWIVKT
jgi:hypothetical protein